MKRTGKVPGFTLIEILVVMAVMVVLALLLLSAFGAVRERSRQATCASNLKQLGMAIQMYADDNNHYFPAFWTKEGSQLVTWCDLTVPYSKSKQLYVCPSDPIQREYWVGWTISYGINRHLTSMSFGMPSDKLKTVSHVVRPSATVLITDAGTTPAAGVPPLQWPQKEGITMGIMDASTENMTQSNTSDSAPHARHNGRSNVLWVDGHVSTLPMESFYNSPDHLRPGATIRGISPCLRPEQGCP